MTQLDWTLMPPTGPDSEAFTWEDGQPEAYVVWRTSEAGKAALTWMARRAWDRVQEGATRVSVNWLSDCLRAECHVRHCNTWRPWIATDLVALWPVLLPYIQRKVRRKREPATFR